MKKKMLNFDKNMNYFNLFLSDFSFFNQTFEQILRHFKQSYDCMIAAFRNYGVHQASECKQSVYGLGPTLCLQVGRDFSLFLTGPLFEKFDEQKQLSLGTQSFVSYTSSCWFGAGNFQNLKIVHTQKLKISESVMVSRYMSFIIPFSQQRILLYTNTLREDMASLWIKRVGKR